MYSTCVYQTALSLCDEVYEKGFGCVYSGKTKNIKYDPFLFMFLNLYFLSTCPYKGLITQWHDRERRVRMKILCM